MARLLAVSESYSDLKANQSFLGLQQELAGTEGQVATVRTRYNDAVRRLINTALQSFPALLIAGLFGFKEEPFFEAPAGEREPPEVQF